jgi:hypothetical protein
MEARWRARQECGGVHAKDGVDAGSASQACAQRAAEAVAAKHKDVGGVIGAIVATPGVISGGTFGNVGSSAAQARRDGAAAVRRDRCFDASLLGPPSVRRRRFAAASDIGAAPYRAKIEEALNAARTGADEALRDYVFQRKGMFAVLHRAYGPAGLALARQLYAQPAHAQALALLSARLRDPAFKAALTPTVFAEYELLTTSPAISFHAGRMTAPPERHVARFRSPPAAT